MIPKIIHYCWFWGGELPDLEQKCLASWKEHMPDWEYRWWNEDTFDIATAPLYVRQAYEARKFAFVSDYVRLWALEKFGGLYMDVDFMVYRPFDELMDKYTAFAGYEGSKRNPVMQGVIASEVHGEWVTDMLLTYDTREFIKEDGSLDMTPNTSFFTDRLEAHGCVSDGKEKDFYLNDEMSRDKSLNEPLSLNDGCLFKEGIYFEDTEWTPRMLCRAKRVASTKKVVYNYLWREGSITLPDNPQKREKVLRDKIALIRGFKEQQKLVKDKSWFVWMTSGTAMSVLGMLARMKSNERKSYLHELKSMHIFPLSIKREKALSHRVKTILANISPSIYCTLMSLRK